MPSPLNTPTSDQDSKSLFDSNENLNSLNSSSSSSSNNTSINIDCGSGSGGGGGGKKLTIIITEDLNNNKETPPVANTVARVNDDDDDDDGVNPFPTIPIPLMDGQQLKEPIKMQSSPPIKGEVGVAIASASATETTGSATDDQSLWHNSSLKYRRARLNLNLVPLNNLSLPQIVPPALPTCYQNHHVTIHNNSGVGSKCGTSSSSSASSSSYNDCFQFDCKNHHQQQQQPPPPNRTAAGSSSSALTDSDSTLLLIQPPRLSSPKYNAAKFEPIGSMATGGHHHFPFGQHSSLVNVISTIDPTDQDGHHPRFNGFADDHHSSSSLVNINNNNNNNNHLDTEQNNNNNDGHHHQDPFGSFQKNPRKYGKYSVPNVKCFEYQNAIRIDPNMDIEQQEWFHGYVSRKEAEKILAKKAVGSYLVRDWRRSYIISLKSIFGCIHFRLFRCDHSRKWSLTPPACADHGTTKPSTSSTTSSLSSNGVRYHFDTIPQLIDYFTIHHLPLNGCEHMALLYPVPVRLL